MSKEDLKKVGMGVLMGLLLGGGLSVFAVWNEPTVPPADGNPSAPINVSNVGQTKGGNLVVNANNQYANGLLVPFGNVLLGGSVSSGVKLDVGGTVRSTAQSVPTSGSGAELIFSGGDSYLTSIDRNTTTFKPFHLTGSTVYINSDTPDVPGSFGPVLIGTTNAAANAKLNVGGPIVVSTDVAYPGGGLSGIWRQAGVGLIVQGMGSSYDVTLVNKNGTTALTVPTGTTNVSFGGAVLVPTDINYPGVNLTGIWKQASAGLVIQGKGTASDVLIANKNGGDVLTIPTGTTNAVFAGKVQSGKFCTATGGRCFDVEVLCAKVAGLCN